MLTSAQSTINPVFVQSVQDAEARQLASVPSEVLSTLTEPNTKTIRVLINVSTQLRDADQPEKNQEADTVTVKPGTTPLTDPVKYVRLIYNVVCDRTQYLAN
jgi:hypothetical protein